jgi:ectoine hydroxylase-related dioxygenase (phytanoyl-CoA dioxygenase family)
MLNEIHQHYYLDNGYVVIPGLFSAEETARYRDHYMDLRREPRPNDDTEIVLTGNDPIKRYPRLIKPHQWDELTMRWMLEPRLFDCMTGLLGNEPYAAQTMVYFKPPGARGQALHQDNFYLRVKPGTCMAAWLAIDDADEDNGGMMCVPQTAGLAIACPQKADPTVFFTTEHVEPPAGLKPEPLRLTAGDVLFFNGSVIHGSTPNASAHRFRRSFICHYVPASTMEMSRYYEAYDFAGVRREVGANEDGGPCGTPQDLPTAPH